MTQLVASASYADAFEQIQRDHAGPAAIADLRRVAFDRFLINGLPTTSSEEWRFTNVRPIADTTFVSGHAVALTNEELAPFNVTGSLGGWPTIVFVNGHYQAALSSVAELPDGVVVESLANVLNSPSGNPVVEQYLGKGADIHSDSAAFAALNTALFGDGVFVHVAANVVVDSPIQVLFVTTPRSTDSDTTEYPMTHPRILIAVEENSEIRLVENYGGEGNTPYLTNAVTEVIGGANAVIDHYKLVREASAAYHIGHMHLRLSRGVNFSAHAITLGGNIVRNDTMAVLDGEGVSCTLNGLYIANQQRLVDNHTTIYHAKPHCESYELYKGILDDQAHAVFNGKIVVAIDAQKTDAKQTNKALLLSEDAQINTKPELEIFADDVKCTHGATVGQLDADAMFYLRARGLGLEQARSVLIHAFASDLLNRIGIASIRAGLDELLLAQLPGSGESGFYEFG